MGGDERNDPLKLVSVRIDTDEGMWQQVCREDDPPSGYGTEWAATAPPRRKYAKPSSKGTRKQLSANTVMDR